MSEWKSQKGLILDRTLFGGENLGEELIEADEGLGREEMEEDEAVTDVEEEEGARCLKRKQEEEEIEEGANEVEIVFDENADEDIQ